MATKTGASSSKKTTIEKSKIKTSTAKADKGSTVVSYSSICAKAKKMPLVRALIAEFIGTFLLVAAYFAVQGQPLYVAFATIGIVLLIGGISGAYINPALTIGAWVTQKIKSVYALGYIVAEVLGGVASWLVLSTLLHGVDKTATSTMFHAATVTSGKEWAFFFAELLGTAIIALGISVAIRIKKTNSSAAFAYGFATLIALLFAGWVTSTSLTESNTALSFLNPAIAAAANGLSWNMWPIAIYVVAPVIGGVIGFVIQDLLKSEDSCCDCECCDVK
jgi:aquaporin Z